MAGFTAQEWRNIEAELESNPARYGLPEGGREGSLVFSSFNIRKLGRADGRKREISFMAGFCARCDLVAVQEVQDNLEGLSYLKEQMERHVAGEDEFDIVLSDVTGKVPGKRGMAERLAYIYRRRRVRRAELASDISIDATGILLNLARNPDPVIAQLASAEVSNYRDAYAKFTEELAKYAANLADRTPSLPKKPVVDFNTFLTFIRTPHIAAFEAPAAHGQKPLRFIAVNTHLIYGKMAERRREFQELLEWLIFRLAEEDRMVAPNFILLGDLNLDFDNPEKDRKAIENHLTTLNAVAFGRSNIRRVYFPFIDPHPVSNRVIRTNARQKETFDQIGLFRGRDEERLPDDRWARWRAGPGRDDPDGFDYNVFNFADLFAKATLGMTHKSLTAAEVKELGKKFEHRVSDHTPIWVRLPRPGFKTPPDLRGL